MTVLEQEVKMPVMTDQLAQVDGSSMAQKP